MGVFMLVSLAWVHPSVGHHTDLSIQRDTVEYDGFWGLLLSTLICFGVGGVLMAFGRKSEDRLFRKEAMAVVGLSWVLATVLGALPFMLSGTCRGPSVRLFVQDSTVLVVAPRWQIWESWQAVDQVSPEAFDVLNVIVSNNAKGVSRSELAIDSGQANAVELFGQLQSIPQLRPWLIGPGEDDDAPADRASNYRLRWVPMGLFDSMFESQSGFSTTGATVICDLEDPYIVPRSILFWRASTHFLGGLGIIVLFVVLLGQGSAGKALMRTEVPGPTQDNSSARVQHAAWLFATIYSALNVLLAIIFMVLGMSMFDAVCHAFATMATGGFSTYNASLGHFAQNMPNLNGELIEYIVIVFMILAGTNFTLLFFAIIGKPGKLLGDVEWRAYIGIILLVSGAIIGFGMYFGDRDFTSIESAIRCGLFQVVSIVTTTGYGTSDFDSWNQFGRGILLMLMFVGGCAGSTGGGMKVIRHVLFVKILGMEVEKSFRPKAVRLLRLGGKPVGDKNLRHTILVYFGLVTVLFLIGWLFILTIEPDATWGVNADNKLIDSASSVAATLNNIGPGLGNVGATQNYSCFSFASKGMFIWLMMLGRLEIFPILVLLAPGFWRDQ